MVDAMKKNKKAKIPENMDFSKPDRLNLFIKGYLDCTDMSYIS